MSVILSVNNITKTFNNGKVIALNKVSFDLVKGNILAVVGESGSGKTTLTRLITGLETLDSGIIQLKGKEVSSDTVFVNPEDRKVGLVFQDYALFPHLTVFDNIAYGISKGVNKKERCLLYTSDAADE